MYASPMCECACVRALGPDSPMHPTAPVCVCVCCVLFVCVIFGVLCCVVLCCFVCVYAERAAPVCVCMCAVFVCAISMCVYVVFCV
jgi:hypothetical protein